MVRPRCMRHRRPALQFAPLCRGCRQPSRLCGPQCRRTRRADRTARQTCRGAQRVGATVCRTTAAQCMLHDELRSAVAKRCQQRLRVVPRACRHSCVNGGIGVLCDTDGRICITGPPHRHCRCGSAAGHSLRPHRRSRRKEGRCDTADHGCALRQARSAGIKLVVSVHQGLTHFSNSKPSGTGLWQQLRYSAMKRGPVHQTQRCCCS